MKLDIGPIRSTYVAPNFDGNDRSIATDPGLRRRIRRPMLLGAGVIAVLVLGVGAVASVIPVESGVNAPAEVRIESNRKTIRAGSTGSVRQILVKEGQLVRAGQTLIVFDDVEARAAFDVLQNQYDALLAQTARLTAEATNASSVQFPAELTSRMADPRISGMVRDQEFLFTTRLQLFQSQTSVLQQRLDQIQNQIAGDQAQVDSVEEQRRLTDEELDGYRKLNAQGYAPKTLILRYERTLADLAGKKGSLMADMSRLRQQMGETRMNMVALRDQRTSQAADGLREAQSRIADLSPRLTAARQTLEGTIKKSPVDGYVFNLTQFTVGGVVGAGELLMDIVPSNSPMVFTAKVNPQDIDAIHIGMDAQVKLIGQGVKWRNAMPAKVTAISADRITDEKAGVAYYRVDLAINPKDLKDLNDNHPMVPGQLAQAMIVTGKQTYMSYLISPITDTINHAFREP